MKSNGSLFLIALVASLTFIISCKAKKEMNDPTKLEVHVLVELKKGVSPKRVQDELKQFEINDFKQSNKTLNQYIFKVLLKGQNADELLRELNSKDYIISAIIAPRGDGPAENMPSGKSTRTTPVKG